MKKRRAPVWERLKVCLVGAGMAMGFGAWAQASPSSSQNSFDVDLSIIDKKTAPCDDFYQYACGGWLEKAQIPEDRPMWSRSFSTIDQGNREKLKGILEKYAQGDSKPENPYSKKLGDFYHACVSEDSIEKNSLGELNTELKSIEQLTDVKQLAPLIAKLHLEGADVFFDFGEEQDAKDSTQVIGTVDQGGKGLPDRDYYLKNDPKMREIKKQYLEHVTRVFQLLGEDSSHARSQAQVVLEIESSLAQASLSRVDRRDPLNVYHRLERAGLKTRAPLFGWDEYFNNLNAEETKSLQAINIAVPDFVSEFNSLLKKTSLLNLKTYLSWRLVDAFTEALPARFIQEKFDFVSRALSGQKKIESRWKRCVKATDNQLGFALGRSFVEIAYGEDGKAKSQSMIKNIESAFQALLKKLPWMDESTKREALRKLGKINNKIGYPDHWRNYDALKVDRNSYLKSLISARGFMSQYELSKIGRPVDKNEWQMTPPMVNAYYNSSMNEIVFPAGILQYPFFNRLSPDTSNFGAIGVVMGHELTHGFDDQGRKFNAEGNLTDWWSEKVEQDFVKKAACVEQEYSSFEALPGLFVNGKLTLGENIADQGGMALSYSAWRASLIREPSSSGVSPNGSGLVPEQKFFLAFAQSWCQKEQEQFTRMRVTTLSQFEPFAKAFGCAPSSKMAPENRCKVW